MFDDFDVLLVDLIDVGTRVYTFVWTVIYCLQTAAETGRKVVILDRPNPIGGHLVEGNLLKQEWSSFVGLYEIPMRHGMTLGELALLCNREMGINADLEVIQVQGWRRDMHHDRGCFSLGFPITQHAVSGRPPWSIPARLSGKGQMFPRGGARRCLLCSAVLRICDHQGC